MSDWDKGELRFCDGGCEETVKCLYVIDPYLEEIHGETEYVWMCKHCYDSACDDI